jgi:hypothetical protein
MAFQALDHMIQKVSGGNFYRWDWSAVIPATLTASRWYDLSSTMRSQPANAWAGTSLAWRTCDESTGNGTQIFGMPHGGNVSTATKHVITATGGSGTSTALGVLQLIDMQGYWPGISTASASAQTLTGTPSLRYTNGAGCRLYWVQTVAAGATPHNIALSYTNTAGTPGQALGRTVSMTASAIVNHISHSGTAAGNIGPFLPLAAGDTGVQNVASVTFSASSGAGSGALVLAKPLLTIPLTTGFLLTERDCISMLPSLPEIKDGACLTWMFYTHAATAASSNMHGNLDLGWA